MGDQQGQASVQDVVDLQQDRDREQGAAAERLKSNTPAAPTGTATGKSTMVPQAQAIPEVRLGETQQVLTGRPAERIEITVAPFTGGPFGVLVSKRDTVEELKKIIAKKLKVLKDRICLLYRER
jgi:hypothetical protein